MKFSAFYTLCYAAVLGIVCAVLLTAASSFTAPYKAANAEVERVLNIVTALNVPLPEKVSAAEILEVFKDNVREQSKGGLTVYEYVPAGSDGQAQAMVAQFEGPGLWGPIKGFLALESDMKTIRGLTFYEQEETPGLGGEIVAGWFREQFAGKTIVDAQGKAGIEIGGSESGPNRVDGISGATMTCDKVEAMLNELVESLVEENSSDGE